MKKVLQLIFVISLIQSAYAQSRYIDVESGIDESDLINSYKLFYSPKSKKMPLNFKGELRGMAMGYTEVCVLDELSVKCIQHKLSESGFEVEGFYEPKLVRPKNIVGSSYVLSSVFCSIDEENLKCWEKGKAIHVPNDLLNPSAVSIGNKFICALDENGVRCWGENTAAIQVPKDLKNVDKLVSSDVYSCALSEGKVRCWGNVADELPAGESNIQDLQLYENTICVLTDYWKCWQNEKNGEVYAFRFLKNLFSYGAKSKLFNSFKFYSLAEGINSLVGIYTPHSRDYSSADEAKVTYKNVKFFDKKGSLICAVDDDGLHCSSLWTMNNPEGRRQFFIPSGLKDVIDLKVDTKNFATCAQFESGHRCWRYYIKTENAPNYYRERDYYVHLYEHKYADGDYAEMVSLDKKYICGLIKNVVTCSVDPNNYHKHTVMPLKKPVSLNGSCVIDEGKIKCWDFRKSDYKGELVSDLKIIHIDYSRYLYSEKSIPLKLADDILSHVEDAPENVLGLMYLREIFLTNLLTGFNTDTSKTILENSLFLKEHFKVMNNEMIQNLSQRSSLQLRFILELHSSSLKSMKTLMSSSSKITIDRLLLDLANILSEDEISNEIAMQFLEKLFNEAKLLNEMSSSHRLVGFKSYFDWSKNYLITGKVE